MKIGFVGMSHLGVCHAVTSAEKGFDVKCFDDSELKIQRLRDGIIDFYEPKLSHLLKKNKKKIKFFYEFDNLKNCDLVFFSKDIPTDKNDQSLYDNIDKLIKKVLKKINKKAILIILSQVKPGFTENIKWSKNHLYYQVETLIFGEAVKRALYPDQFIIGSYKKKLNIKYLKYLETYSSKINIMNYKSAELSKISINLYLISSISFTNSLAELCEKIDADWNKISMILKKDKRIGKYAYLKPGLGVLSGNLQRDLQTYKKVLKDNKCNLEIPLAWQKNSNYRKDWIIGLLKNQLKSFLKKKIGIYGLTYKKNITILKNSPTISLLKKFRKINFNLYDPKVSSKGLNLKNGIIYKNLSKFLKSTDLLIILTDWDEIKNCTYDILSNYKGKNIIDPYNTINLKRFIKNKKIFSLATKIK